MKCVKTWVHVDWALGMNLGAQTEGFQTTALGKSYISSSNLYQLLKGNDILVYLYLFEEGQDRPVNISKMPGKEQMANDIL